jgi:calcium permeable stress-gated cation channel
LIRERVDALPGGWFKWLKVFIHVPDTEVLTHSSLDGFLFLRFVKMLCIICLVGCCLAWPILIPLHIVGGGSSSELDRLTIGNVTNPQWYFAHVVVAWLFFGKPSPIPCLLTRVHRPHGIDSFCRSADVLMLY